MAEKPILTKKKAAYATGAAAIADILVSFFSTDYPGFFASLARLLTGE